MVPCSGFAACREAVLVGGHAEQVHGHVFDGVHVFGAVCGPRAHEIVVENDVEHPREPVLDAPVGAPRGQKAWR